ncbi:hypothetical protein QYE76_004271 [Lolium multiflorum]|uniref:Uncharacterized protein n=1 Tax=Lolium multiflorum TaxID=4521 RepID=A0AAD8W2A8_LOLMU|nr:hypothetical protein QYE76_004271 [Lolium multiflorum]
MLSSSSASQLKWARYGPVPLGSCPDCPWTAPLKRLVTTSDKNGNAGRDFVKFESKAEPGKNLAKCTHFEWLDEYIGKIEMEGATLGLNFPSAVEQLGSTTTVGKLKEVAKEMGLKELKKINKQLVKLVNLKRQDNLMAGLFYFFVISLSFVYLLIINRLTKQSVFA